MTSRFNPLKADAHWQTLWEERGTFRASDESERPKIYILGCSPIRRGASTSATSAIMRWGTYSPAIGG